MRIPRPYASKGATQHLTRCGTIVRFGLEVATPMKVLMDGKPVDGERVAFEPVEEPWTKCKLPDGTIIRLKLVVTDVIRLHENQPSGEPHYIVKSSNVLAVEEPETHSEVH